VFDMRLKSIGGTGRILLNNAFEDIAMLVDNLHERPGSTGCDRTPHQNHVSERIHVVSKTTVARKGQQSVVKAAVTPPHALLIARGGSPFHRIKRRSQQTDAVFIEAFNCPPAGGDLEKKADFEDFVKIVDRGLQDADSVVAFKPDHAAGAQVDQRFTNRSSRHAKACGKLAHRVKASRQQIARCDRIAKDLGDLLLETHLFGNRAKGVQAGFGSARPSPGDFFQGANRSPAVANGPPSSPLDAPIRITRLGETLTGGQP
jgi:hypothetical protein